MFRKVALALLILLVALLGFATTKPNTFQIQRTASINAPPEKIFALIDDFHAWGSWSPYEKLDPAMTRTYSGATNGEGAVYAWEGNSKAGAGRMEILESLPHSRTTIQLDFIKPMEGHNTAEFTLRPDGDATEVTWSMHGPMPYVSKVMSVFFSMDRMIGKDFEAGLANLKTVAEG